MVSPYAARCALPSELGRCGKAYGSADSDDRVRPKQYCPRDVPSASGGHAPYEIVSDAVTMLSWIKSARPILSMAYGIWTLCIPRHLALGTSRCARPRKHAAQADRACRLDQLPSRVTDWSKEYATSSCMPPRILRRNDRLEILRRDYLRAESYAPLPTDHPWRGSAQGVPSVKLDIAWETLGQPVIVLAGLYDRFVQIQDDVNKRVALLRNTMVRTDHNGGRSRQAEHPERFVTNDIGFVAQLKTPSEGE